MGWPFVKRRMMTELGPKCSSAMLRSRRTPPRRRAWARFTAPTSHEGWSLACKLQYPDMQSAVEADLRQLRLIFSIYERYDRAIVTREIHAEIAARLRAELDYRLEAKHMGSTEPCWQGAGCRVPVPLEDLSTGRLLSMTWLEGTPLLPFIKAHGALELRNRVAYNMFRAWYVPFYFYG